MRTGPEPIVSPTEEPVSGCDCTGVVGTAIEESFEPKLKPLVGPQPASAREAQPAKAALRILRKLRRRRAGRDLGSETIDKRTSRISNYAMIAPLPHSKRRPEALETTRALFARKCGILFLGW
jgi:hypothetical protein